MLGDLEHQALPFEHLVAELNPERDLSVGQLVQVMFNYYPATELTEQVPGLEVQPIDVNRARAKFDLTCTVVDSRDRMRVTLTYATELLGHDLVTRLGEHFIAVLDALVTDLDAPAATLVPAPPSDAALPPAAAGAANRAPRHDAPALSRFEVQAQAHPARTAVQCPEGSISYRNLNCRANQLARYLDERKSGSGPVALLFERSVDYVVAMFAAMKAGRTYVPLDSAMPASHIAAVLRVAGADLLLTHGEVDWAQVAAAAPGPVDIAVLADIDAELAGYRVETPARHAGADHADRAHRPRRRHAGRPGNRARRSVDPDRGALPGPALPEAGGNDLEGDQRRPALHCPTSQPGRHDRVLWSPTSPNRLATSAPAGSLMRSSNRPWPTAAG